MKSFIGIDVGTSACRACAIDENARVIARARTALPAPHRDGVRVEQAPEVWWQALLHTLDRLNRQLDPAGVERIALDGTSSTLLLSDRNGAPITPGLMYNDCRAVTEAGRINQVAPPESAAAGASSSLAKLLHLTAQTTVNQGVALHQADWLSGKLTGSFGITDENNALKLGYDALARCWPEWLRQLELPEGCLPDVFPPGTVIAPVTAALVRRWGWPRTARVVAGTTDSTAGFIATGATHNATAVTALGSTLVLKVLSEKPVFSASHGVYSHRLGDRWLAGGASNSGGAVLTQLFKSCDIHRYSRLIDPGQPTGLDYYPLPGKGERFPFADPQLQPRLTPRPESDCRFFQGILEGLATIEQQGYQRLAALGAPFPTQVITVGGGGVNRAWSQIRERMLGVPVTRAAQQQAAYGAALLARGD